MSRPPRIEIANGVYHVVARGNERRPVFRDDVDRSRFLEVLGNVMARFRWRVLCFCLMSNHYHLLVLTVEPNLARGMRQLNGVYAQWFNRRHERVGHLFSGRYKAVLVQRERHLPAAVRYIVRNPVRAQLVRRVDEWRWSSHGATVGNGVASVVSVGELLALLGADESSSRARYLELVSDATETVPVAHPLLDGDDDFVKTHLALLRPSPEYPRAFIGPRRPELCNLVSSSDESAAVYRAYAVHGYSMRQIATHLGCGTTTIHRRVREHEALGSERGRPDPVDRNMEDLTPGFPAVGSPPAASTRRAPDR